MKMAKANCKFHRRRRRRPNARVDEPNQQLPAIKVNKSFFHDLFAHLITNFYFSLAEDEYKSALDEMKAGVLKFFLDEENEEKEKTDWKDAKDDDGEDYEDLKCILRWSPKLLFWPIRVL